MKTKDIIILVVAITVIVVSVFIGYSLLFPSQKKAENIVAESQQVPKVPTEIDEKTYKSIENLSDYGKPELSGIGKPDLFSGF